MLTAGAAVAQQRQMPAPTNLKVLPGDIEPQRLMGIMRNISAGLGVRCTHCHTPPNFASDEKAREGDRPRHDADGAKHPPAR
ncbi:MAG: hypothetical protein H6509_16300 [Bryobacterales bacterium]|nr:hypothetical protein [Bryobacterales bacterium]